MRGAEPLALFENLRLRRELARLGGDILAQLCFRPVGRFIRLRSSR
jgi:hypothetical protein